MGDVTRMMTDGITALPGLDEREWPKFAPIARQMINKNGLGTAAADAILADVKLRVLRAAPVATEGGVPKDYQRIVSQAYFELLCEIVVLATELYVARTYPGAGAANDG